MWSARSGSPGEAPGWVTAAFWAVIWAVVVGLPKLLRVLRRK